MLSSVTVGWSGGDSFTEVVIVTVESDAPIYLMVLCTLCTRTYQWSLAMATAVVNVAEHYVKPFGTVTKVRLE